VKCPSKSSTGKGQRRAPLQTLHINVPLAQSSARSSSKKTKRGLSQTEFTIFQDTSAFRFVDGPAPKKFRNGRMPLGERKDFANITPTPSPRLPDTPWTPSSDDTFWTARENYDPRPITPVSPFVIESPSTRCWDNVPVNGGPSPPLTPPPFDSPRRCTFPLRRCTARATLLCAPVDMELYEILELSDWNVGADAILAAYRKLVLIWHPDKVCEEEQEAATAMMQDLNGAKEVLMDAVRRREYHQTGALPWNV